MSSNGCSQIRSIQIRHSNFHRAYDHPQCFATPRARPISALPHCTDTNQTSQNTSLLQSMQVCVHAPEAILKCDGTVTRARADGKIPFTRDSSQALRRHRENTLRILEFAHFRFEIATVLHAKPLQQTCLHGWYCCYGAGV